VRLGPDDYLLDHLGGGFDLLLFTRGPSVAPALLAVIEEARGRGVPLRVTAVGAAQAVCGADRTLPDPDGRVRERHGVAADGAAYLLRPDQHVCARWLALDPTRLRAALAAALPA
jgi:3-(3-hydroxy-phenyl)propionate hydroxylase